MEGTADVVQPEKDMKRRKIDEKVMVIPLKDCLIDIPMCPVTPPWTASCDSRTFVTESQQEDQPGKDKEMEKRKRERSSDKETSEAKRRRDSPHDDSSSSASPQPDTKRRLVKAGSKKDVAKLQETSPLTTKKTKQETVKNVTAKQEEKAKKHASRVAKKEKT
jgi:hypothetical protein